MERHGALRTRKIDGMLKPRNALGIAIGGAGLAVTADDCIEVMVMMTSDKQVVIKKSKWQCLLLQEYDNANGVFPS